ncbi:hypothetical protein SMACR_07705 [Sordaria macrospora]|uniref:WGS project CABT00000000 data, contig 2.27 n=2 Tax=Sordaria macrospora TaxID=5147 RepID=F7W4E5_SORMK|nr:uncharacterized protein SMAC_07705 [Sordaria macrospora k-hell]KAA8634892.1 hypothetical protein SMACR_07705 [Sordaria macrospora]WPJ67397.1 hypothetical protein SMAC4_07705 [Sordaria macrospora]CCC14898.1 unnamed protein product [Sordaria macrospora k-hell]
MRHYQSFAYPATPAPAAYGQRTHAIAGAGYGNAHGSEYLANFASPQFQPSNLMPWDNPFAFGNPLTHNPSHMQSQMGSRGRIDILLNGMPTVTGSGPSQMSSPLEGLFPTGGQSSNNGGSCFSTSENSGPPIHVPPPPEQKRLHIPLPNTGPGSPSPSPSPSYPNRRSIACPVCGHTSTTKRDMQRHIDDRHDDRPEDLSGTGWSLSPEMTCPYAACGGCEFKYRRKDRLKRHEETVHRR